MFGMEKSKNISFFLNDTDLRAQSKWNLICYELKNYN